MNTRLTVNLTPRALHALERACEREKLNKTDVVNRALRVYEWAMQVTSEGGHLAVINDDGRVMERVRFL